MSIQKLALISLAIVNPDTVIGSTGDRVTFGDHSKLVQANNAKYIETIAEELTECNASFNSILLNHTVFQGDMIDFDWERFTTGQRRFSVIDNRTFRWPSSKISYVFKDKLSVVIRENVRVAMEIIEEVSCIRFKETERWKLKRGEEYFQIEYIDGGCASHVVLTCRLLIRNCVPTMYISPYCTAGGICHQLMHILGYIHEHSRPDRDEDVQIKFEYFDLRTYPDALQNLEKVNYPASMDKKYDLKSIMHFPRTAFAKKGKQTIYSRLILPRDSIWGEQVNLSSTDIDRLEKHYCDIHSE